jgi:hypothetical protein
MKIDKYLGIIGTFLLAQNALAQDFEDVVTEVELVYCVAAPTLVQKIVLYGLPLILAIGVGLIVSKIWGSKAVARTVDPASQQTAGYTFGLWIGSFAFVGLLYATSGLSKAGDITTIVETGSCFPNGWEVIVGVFLLITTCLFLITKMNAK